MSNQMHPIKLLLVEDNLMCAKAQQGLFKCLKCEVEVARNMTSALEKLKEQLFQLVVCDLGLPDGNGFDIARYIRQCPPPINTTPIVILTAHGDDTHKEQARKIGCNAFVEKPLTYELCEEILKEMLQ